MNRILLPGLLVALGTAHAQQEMPGPLEEVTVRVERPLGILRQDVAKAEIALYDAFNELFEDTDYEIHCFETTPTGSRIGHDVCQPAFVRELQRLATQRAFDIGAVDLASQTIDFSILRVAGNPGTETANETRKMLAEMFTAVYEDPGVQRAFIDYMQKRRVLDLALRHEPRRQRD